jgi:hypothetical protein
MKHKTNIFVSTIKLYIFLNKQANIKTLLYKTCYKLNSINENAKFIGKRLIFRYLFSLSIFVCVWVSRDLLRDTCHVRLIIDRPEFGENTEESNTGRIFSGTRRQRCVRPVPTGNKLTFMLCRLVIYYCRVNAQNALKVSCL